MNKTAAMKIASAMEGEIALKTAIKLAHQVAVLEVRSEMNKTAGAMQGTFNAIDPYFDPSMLTRIINALKGYGGNLMEGLRTAGGSAMEAIQNLGSSGAEMFSNLLNRARSGLSNALANRPGMPAASLDDIAMQGAEGGMEQFGLRADDIAGQMARAPLGPDMKYFRDLGKGGSRKTMRELLGM